MTLDVFEVFEATLLQDCPEENLKAGTVVFGCRPPHGQVYLSEEGRVGKRGQGGGQGAVFNANAQLGVHFSAAPDIEAALNAPNPFVREPGQIGLWRPR